jgi:hypothetical protein
MLQKGCFWSYAMAYVVPGKKKKIWRAFFAVIHGVTLQQQIVPRKKKTKIGSSASLINLFFCQLLL